MIAVDPGGLQADASSTRRLRDDVAALHRLLGGAFTTLAAAAGDPPVAAGAESAWARWGAGLAGAALDLEALAECLGDAATLYTATDVAVARAAGNVP